MGFPSPSLFPPKEPKKAPPPRRGFFIFAPRVLVWIAPVAAVTPPRLTCRSALFTLWQNVQPEGAKK